MGHAGFVDSLPAVYEGARGVVAPVVRGAGVNNKVLEPLAAGRAVVTTTVGTRGLPPEISSHLRVAETGEQFAAQTLELIASPGTMADAERAREAVGLLSWDAAAEKMEDTLFGVVSASRGQGPHAG
jgi:glycosyltransferase involved in cell wall biosynthesis